ncbi:hypothetical protein ACVWYU_000652 [Pseudomonas sp. TE12234]
MSWGWSLSHPCRAGLLAKNVYTFCLIHCGVWIASKPAPAGRHDTHE